MRFLDSNTHQNNVTPNPSGKGAGPASVTRKRLSRGGPTKQQVFYIPRLERERKLETGSHGHRDGEGGDRLPRLSHPREHSFPVRAQGRPRAPTPRLGRHLHNTFTFEGSSQIGASRSLSEARFSIIAIRNRNRITIAVEIQLLSCGWMKQKNLCVLKTRL